MRITRLGAGVDRTGRLDEGAIGRTLGVLAEYRSLLEAYGVAPSCVRVAATSATRDASNQEAFLEGAEEILAVRPEVIEGAEEGRLSYKGATADLDPSDGPYLVADIGGGSTELVAGDPTSPQGSEPAGVVSLDVGCVRLTERFLASDPPSAPELAKARSAVRELLGDVARDRAFCSARRLVGLAGTVSALTVMALGLDSFDERAVHHARVSRRSVSELTEALSTVALGERLQIPNLERERADVIVGGCIVLEEVMDAFGYEELTASESDILDGIAYELLESSPSRARAAPPR